MFDPKAEARRARRDAAREYRYARKLERNAEEYIRYAESFESNARWLEVHGETQPGNAAALFVAAASHRRLAVQAHELAPGYRARARGANRRARRYEQMRGDS